MKFLDIPEPLDDDVSRFSTARSIRLRADWFIRIRWLAMTASLILGFVADKMSPDLNFTYIIIFIIALITVNVCYFSYSKQVAIQSLQYEKYFVKIQMLIDLILLTILIHYTGGIENPLFFIYFIHVIIASLMFKGKEVYLIATVAILLFSGEVVLSGGNSFMPTGFLNHHHIISGGDHLHDVNYILMMLASFWFVILFTAFVTSSMMDRYRVIRDKLVRNQKKLISAEKEKMDFFRFVTHEIKSPVSTSLSAINAVLELYSTELNDNARNLLNRAQGRSQQAIDMVKDLSELTQGAIHHQQIRGNIELCTLIRKIVDDELGNNPKNIITEFILPKTSIELSTYPDLLEKVLVNIISNGIRYNKESGKLIVKLQRDNRLILISITDEGIGISASDIPKIYEEFFRSSEAKQTAKIGTGLGLAIVKRFVGKLNGHISVTSELGAGTTFVIKLPENV
ncbi:MAG: HAMP domain-containing histidine kinase [Bacteroidetes bacterium]|jgi:two-component system, OmpR family, phosphate regulon sensor histidine kinase PhoR|nr:HAMP domain-containing histidine kinase [Bacteroidota bacterium]